MDQQENIYGSGPTCILSKNNRNNGSNNGSNNNNNRSSGTTKTNTNTGIHTKKSHTLDSRSRSSNSNSKRQQRRKNCLRWTLQTQTLCMLIVASIAAFLSPLFLFTSNHASKHNSGQSLAAGAKQGEDDPSSFGITVFDETFSGNDNNKELIRETNQKTANATSRMLRELQQTDAFLQQRTMVKKKEQEHHQEHSSLSWSFRILCTASRRMMGFGSFRIRCLDFRSYCQQYYTTNSNNNNNNNTVTIDVNPVPGAHYNATVFVKTIPKFNTSLYTTNRIYIDVVDQLSFLRAARGGDLKIIKAFRKANGILVQNEPMRQLFSQYNKHVVTVTHWFNSFPADNQQEPVGPLPPPWTNHSGSDGNGNGHQRLRVATVWDSQLDCPTPPSNMSPLIDYQCIRESYNIWHWYHKYERGQETSNSNNNSNSNSNNNHKNVADVQALVQHIRQKRPDLGEGYLYRLLFRQYHVLVVFPKDGFKLQYHNYQRVVSQMRSGVPVVMDCRGEHHAHFCYTLYPQYAAHCAFDSSLSSLSSSSSSSFPDKNNNTNPVTVSLWQRLDALQASPELQKTCQRLGIEITKDFTPRKIVKTYLEALGLFGNDDDDGDDDDTHGVTAATDVGPPQTFLEMSPSPFMETNKTVAEAITTNLPLSQKKMGQYTIAATDADDADDHDKNETSALATAVATTTAPKSTTNVNGYANRNNKETVVICCVIKNEQLYLEEWLDFNLALGFDHLYMYDNSEDHNLKPWMEHYSQKDKVTLKWYPGDKIQRPAYRDCGGLVKQMNHTWVFYADSDEFLVLKKHKHILDFCRDHVKKGATVINWWTMGTSGQDKYVPLPVTFRFQCRPKTSYGQNRMFKAIIRVDHLNHEKIYGPHRFPLLHGHKMHTTAGKGVDQTQIWGPKDVALLYHYYFKSMEEYVKKRARGGVLHGKVKKAAEDAMAGLDIFGQPVPTGSRADGAAWEQFKRLAPKYADYEHHFLAKTLNRTC